jgi:hypothetical protein
MHKTIAGAVAAFAVASILDSTPKPGAKRAHIHGPL